MTQSGDRPWIWESLAAFRLGPARGRRLDNADLASVQVDILPAQGDQFAPAHAREGGQQRQYPVAHRKSVGDGEHGRQRNDIALRGFLLARAVDPARVTPDDLVALAVSKTACRSR